MFANHLIPVHGGVSELQNYYCHGGKVLRLKMCCGWDGWGQVRGGVERRKGSVINECRRLPTGFWNAKKMTEELKVVEQRLLCLVLTPATVCLSRHIVFVAKQSEPDEEEINAANDWNKLFRLSFDDNLRVDFSLTNCTVIWHCSASASSRESKGSALQEVIAKLGMHDG